MTRKNRLVCWFHVPHDQPKIPLNDSFSCQTCSSPKPARNEMRATTKSPNPLLHFIICVSWWKLESNTWNKVAQFLCWEPDVLVGWCRTRVCLSKKKRQMAVDNAIMNGEMLPRPKLQERRLCLVYDVRIPACSIFAWQPTKGKQPQLNVSVSRTPMLYRRRWLLYNSYTRDHWYYIHFPCY